MSVPGVDLPRSALTTILHITPGTYTLTVYYPNYSEIKGNSHLFLKNPKWLSNTSHNIYPMMHLWGRSADRSANCHSWPQDASNNVKLPFWTTRCQYWGVDLLADLPIAILDHKMSVLGGRSANYHSWPQDASSNVKLPFLTTRCQYQG